MTPAGKTEGARAAIQELLFFNSHIPLSEEYRQRARKERSETINKLNVVESKWITCVRTYVFKGK